MATLNLFEIRPPDTVLSQVRGEARRGAARRASICIVIKLSPPSLIRQRRRIPSRRQSTSPPFLATLQTHHSTPSRSLASERVRVQSSWGCVTRHAMPATDERTGGAALFDSSNHHIASPSKSLPVLAARNSRQHGGIFRCRGKGAGPQLQCSGLISYLSGCQVGDAIS